MRWQKRTMFTSLLLKERLNTLVHWREVSANNKGDQDVRKVNAVVAKFVHERM